MNFLRLFLVTVVVITFCALQTDGSIRRRLRRLRFYGAAAPVAVGAGAVALAAAPVAFVPVALTTFAIARPSRIPFLLLLKLLLLKKTLLVATPAVAVGSLMAGSGIGLLAGKLTTLHLLHKLTPYKHIYNVQTHGWGWKSGWAWKAGLGWKKPVRIGIRHKVIGFWLAVAAKQGRKTNRLINNIKNKLGHHKSHHHGGWGWPSTHYSKVAPVHHFHTQPVPHTHSVPSTGWSGSGEYQSYPTYYSRGTHYDSYSHDVDTHYDGDHSTHFEGAYETETGPAYHTQSHDHRQHEESERKPKSVPAPTQPPKRMTDEEYLDGVMKLAFEPINNFLGGIADTLRGIRSYIPTLPSLPVKDDDLEDLLNDEDLNTDASEKQPKSQNGTGSISRSSRSKPWEFPGLTIRESEKYLEEHFESLKSRNPKEALSLLRVLRQAYLTTLKDLGIPNDGKVPDFVPMPVEPEAEQNTTYLDLYEELVNSSASAINEAQPLPVADLIASIDDQLATEVKQFFALLSTFDNETCFEKLVCDIHTRIEENDPDNFTPYESSVLSVFEMLKTVFTPENPPDDITLKYIKAAEFGETHLSSPLCQTEYPICHFTSNEVMDMGAELDKSTTFSIPEVEQNHVDDKNVEEN